MSSLRYVCLFCSSLPPVVCRRDHVFFTLCLFVCLWIVVSNTYYVVSLFCFSVSCVPYVGSFSVFFFVLCTLCWQFLCILHL
jgi:hypothetical protein